MFSNLILIILKSNVFSLISAILVPICLIYVLPKNLKSILFGPIALTYVNLIPYALSNAILVRNIWSFFFFGIFNWHIY